MAECKTHRKEDLIEIKGQQKCLKCIVDNINKNISADKALTYKSTVKELEDKFNEIRCMEFTHAKKTDLINLIIKVRTESLAKDIKISKLKREITIKQSILKDLGVDGATYREILKGVD